MTENGNSGLIVQDLEKSGVQDEITHPATTSKQTMTAALMDVCSVADMLSCSERTVYRLADAGKMPAPLRVGRLVRWSSKALCDWIADGCPVVRVARARV